MRPNQQNNKNRQRGRNNNGGRKHLNPLSRNFESNGPDVKVRGNASHIAEKYLQLARDAQSSGDSVMAENYLQHAEHYFRILSAAQPQNQPRDQFGQPQETEDFDDDFPPINDRFASPERPQNFGNPQFGNQNYNGNNGNQGGYNQNGGYQQPSSEQQPQEGQSSEPAVEQAVPAGGETEFAATDEDGEPRRHRDRRGRRRRGGGQGETGGPGNANADPGEAPQPEVGDLPAFITAGGSTAAE
jgi:hypothetical protein